MGLGSATSTSALFERVLVEVPGGVLDRLSNEDKTSLAGVRWSALEAVLRGSDATLKVDPGRPVLYVLARVLKGGGVSRTDRVWGRGGAGDGGGVVRGGVEGHGWRP
ncbi:unnamed protein product [Pedinophyceae sp. YPF-701]|nr:unnamed protein product [Pedinophyceae sp. YPF-701]